MRRRDQQQPEGDIPVTFLSCAADVMYRGRGLYRGTGQFLLLTLKAAIAREVRAETAATRVWILDRRSIENEQRQLPCLPS